jgi:hypothetical protein
MKKPVKKPAPVAKKKKTAKKSKSPKPSVLLQRALDLFGPKGEFWIEGAEHREREASFLLNGEEVDEFAVRDALNDKITDAVNSFDLSEFDTIGEAIAAATEEITSELEAVPAADLYCAIGAMHEINTPNEAEAQEFLAKAMDSEYDPEGYDRHSTITSGNDDHDWPFVQKAFKKAIKAALKAGR